MRMVRFRSIAFWLIVLLAAAVVAMALPYLYFLSDRVLLDVSWYSPEAGGFEWQRHVLGVTIYRGQSDKLNGWWISIQYSTLLLASILVVLLVGWCHWRRGLPECRSQAGLCPACGYDIRTTPDRCPECGRQLSLTA